MLLRTGHFPQACFLQSAHPLAKPAARGFAGRSCCGTTRSWGRCPAPKAGDQATQTSRFPHPWENGIPPQKDAWNSIYSSRFLSHGKTGGMKSRPPPPEGRGDGSPLRPFISHPQSCHLFTRVDQLPNSSSALWNLSCPSNLPHLLTLYLSPTDLRRT